MLLSAQNTLFTFSVDMIRTLRVKHHLENYMFVTDNAVNFTVAEFKTMLSVHLNLTYDFQLLEVEQNRLES